MNIPAYTSPTLCIGRTYDAEKSTASGDIFPAGLPTKLINVNKFSFKYTVVKDSKDVNDLLDISGKLSLKIKANLLTVEGAGQFVKENKKEEGTTTLMAVMKCTTVTETIDGNVEPSNTTAGVGTHYVRSVTYGAKLVASLKFKSTSTSQKDDIKGSAKGELALQAVNVGLEAALQKLTTECETASDLEVKYHSTGLPDKLPTTIEGLTKLIETFPSRMKDINEGKGIPTMFELLPVTDIIPTARTVLQDRVEEYELEEMEGYFDDIRSALVLANTYQKNAKEKHQDVLDFITTTKKVEKVFRKAISTLGRSEEKEKLEECLEKYEKALDGQLYDDKFVQHWKQIYSSKIPTTSIKLPEGRALSLVLLGKTGNGKSKTGNNILGRQYFKASGAAKSVTKTCLLGQREDEREIDVIDTPGVLDTSAVSWMDKARNVAAYLSKNNEVQNDILKEVARIFAMTPEGFDSFILVTKYGDRFTAEDAQALKMLHKLLGDEAFNNMILVLTHGDQAEREAEENGKTVDETLRVWLSTLPPFVQKFVAAINNRVFLFNNCLRPEKEPEEYKKQLSGLITLIDEMTTGRERFVHKLTGTSKAILEQKIAEALDESGINNQLKEMQKKEEELEIKKNEIKRREEESALKAKKEKEEMEKRMKQLENDKKKQEALEAEIRKKEQERKKQKEKEDKEKRDLEEQIKKARKATTVLQMKKSALITTTTGHQHRSGGAATKAIQDEVQNSGGCYPGSATYVDIHGRPRRMESLKLGDEVQVMINEEIRFEPVITFIHRHPEVMQEFLKITTLKKKILKITEDHLMFVEKEGQAAVIPARDISIGDTVYVKGDQGLMDKDAVQSISTVIEKGVYAPVTLSGTILVNDVHTSCYFDVLSHKWSHRAMGAARAVHYVSPWMLQWISGVGEMDGFPGWCRLAHKMLTFMD